MIAMSVYWANGWAERHKREGAACHHEVCRHSLHYDGKPDLLFEVQIGTWNIGSI